MAEITQADKLMTEKQLVDALVDLAKQLGYFVCHFRSAINQRGHWSTPIQGNAGFPDLVIVGRGMVLFLECKTEKGAATPEQQAWLEALSNPLNVIHANIVQPHDLDSIAKLLAGQN